jgi:hypothetical protein
LCPCKKCGLRGTSVSVFGCIGGYTSPPLAIPRISWQIALELKV